LPSLSAYSFNSKHNLIYKTYISQEMLKKRFLASTNFYPSIAHDYQILEKYTNELNAPFKKISNCEKGLIDPNSLLESSVSHGGFKRLN
jgi:glutamate-1-semialdehyde 2,1-aminomutase